MTAIQTPGEAQAAMLGRIDARDGNANIHRMLWPKNIRVAYEVAWVAIDNAQRAVIEHPCGCQGDNHQCDEDRQYDLAYAEDNEDPHC